MGVIKYFQRSNSDTFLNFSQKITSPKDSGKYDKSWTVKSTQETSNSMEVTVYSKNRYQLAHLLEFGHAKQGGCRIAVKPHIAAAEQAGIESFEKSIERRLRNG